MATAIFDEVKKLVGEQENLLRFWSELSEDQQSAYLTQLRSSTLSDARKWFEDSSRSYTPSPENLKPVPSERYHRISEASQEELESYWNTTLDAVSRGEVAALVLAGGQASRLGSSQPKGTIKLGIDVAFGDSLLGIQAAKIALLQKLAAKKSPGMAGKIQWVVMTSQGTDAATKEHISQIADHYGFSDDQITIFSQQEIAAYDENGDFMLSDKGKLVASPNGNGGLYSALAPHLESLKTRGVKYFHVYCVDNILCKVADPHFLGMAISHAADVATKTVPKKAGELVGSVCLDAGKPRVVEYSELGAELAGMKTANGRYLFGAGSIANHFFTLEFLEKVCSPSTKLPYHRALKKIAFLDDKGVLVKPEKPNGIKLEQFVFDVFEFSENFHLWETNRDDEFSPLKNAESAGVDCMSTCLRDLALLNRRWLESAGAKVPEGGEKVFLKTFVSYNGEGLEEVAAHEVTNDVDSDAVLAKYIACHRCHA